MPSEVKAERSFPAGSSPRLTTPFESERKRRRAHARVKRAAGDRGTGPTKVRSSIGHVNQLPQSEEPATILQGTYRLRTHGYVESWPRQPVRFDEELVKWQALLRTHPASRNAFVGFALLERAKANLTFRDRVV